MSEIHTVQILSETAAKKHCRIARIVRTVDLDEFSQCGTDHKSRNVPVMIQAFNSCVFEAFCFLSFFLKRKIEDLKEKNTVDGQVEIGLNIHDGRV